MTLIEKYDNVLTKCPKCESNEFNTILMYGTPNTVTCSKCGAFVGQTNWVDNEDEVESNITINNHICKFYCQCEKPTVNPNTMICQICQKSIQISKLYKLDLKHLQIKVFKPHKPIFTTKRERLQFWIDRRRWIPKRFKSKGMFFVTMSELITTNFKTNGKLRDLNDK
jgi:hypothetical protein